ncbi:MAG TPA: hypothetical protein G4O15_02035 [Dehalococcoidia bacterium]|nr:hypothetical protein [Dehalococcoidia bacterium]
MGRKSKHGHNKYRTTTIKRKEEPRLATLTIPRPNDDQSPITIPVSSKQKSVAGITATTKITDKEKYNYVINELQLLGILTVVILVVLIVTALILR